MQQPPDPYEQYRQPYNAPTSPYAQLPPYTYNPPPKRPVGIWQWLKTRSRNAKLGIGCGSLIVALLLCICTVAAYGSTTVATTPTPTPTTGNAASVATPTDTPTLAPTPTPQPVQPQPTAAPSCYPLTNGGNCYEPGEYCRNSDHGVRGIAGDGKRIVCTDNDGWRWEPY